MKIKLHKNARTTPKIREEIQKSKESNYKLGKIYGISEATVKKWREAKSLMDKTSRPNNLQTDLNKEEIDLILFERKQYKKSTDEIYCTLRNRIKNLYLMKVYRVLKRYKMNILPVEMVKEEKKIKKFKNYGIGYVHIDLLYAPKINKKRSYIYTAIDRVSKAAFAMIGESKSKICGKDFVEKVIKFYPYKLNYILTDNGHEFTHKALPKGKKTNKQHPFDKVCEINKINHRTIKFHHPWTNGMAERFNRSVRDKFIQRNLFSSIFDMMEKLQKFIDEYNFNSQLKSLSYLSPSEFLEKNKNFTLQRIVS